MLDIDVAAHTSSGMALTLMRTAMSKSASWVAEVLGIAAIYVVTGKLAFLLAIPPGNVTIAWPPSGLALAAVLLLGNGVWPGIWLGSFLVNTWFFSGITNPISVVALAISFSIGVGSTLQALLGASLIRRLIGFGNPIDRPQDVFKFAAIELFSCMLAPSLGVTSLSLAGFVSWDAYAYAWRTWWLGDFTGVIILTPLLLTFSKRPWLPREPRRLAEAVLVVVLLLITSQIVFGGQFQVEVVDYPLEFLLILFPIWMAFRFGQHGVVFSTLIVSGMSMWGTINGFGPFSRETLNQSLILLLTFVSIVTLTGLVLAAAIKENTRAQEALRTSERRLAGALDIAEAAVISVDEAQRVILFDQTAEKIFGYTAQEVLGQPLDLLLPSRSTDVHRQHIRDFSAGAVAARRMGERGEIFGRRKDGTEFPAEVAISKLKQAGGTTFTAVLRDITERKSVEESLHRYSGRLQVLHEIDRAILAAQSPEGIAQAALHHMQQLTPCYWASVTLFDFDVHEAAVLAAHAAGETKMRTGTRLPLESFDFGNIRFLGQGTVHLVEDIETLSPLAPVIQTLKAEGLRSYINVPLITQGRLMGALNLGGRSPGIFTAEHVEIAREVADLLAVAIRQAHLYEQVQRQTVELKYQAMHDFLTDLPNRILLIDRLRQAILAGNREQRPVALLILDLDHFKNVNDAFGHQYGDLLLKAIGPRLRHALRESDTLARLAGDEFVVLLPNTDAEGAALVAQKILEVLKDPFHVEGRALSVATSIGMALFPQHGTDAETLIRHADEAMYLAKRARGKYEIYTPDEDPNPRSRLALSEESRRIKDGKQ